MDKQSIKNKVVFITGALGLIGKTVSLSFLKQGAKVIIADIDEASLKNMLSDLQDFSADVYLLTELDITNKVSCETAVKQSITKFGKVDVLINIAALDAKFDQSADNELNSTSFENFSLSQLDKSYEVNVKGLVQITQCVIKEFLTQGHGNIINVASTYSLVAPNPALYYIGDNTFNFKPVDYVITKSMIPNFTKYLAIHYAKNNIRCNAIAPHGVFNNHSEQFVQNFAKLSPMGRMADKNELTGPFTFLASDASSYMTGSLLTIDGGWTAW